MLSMFKRKGATDAAAYVVGRRHPSPPPVIPGQAVTQVYDRTLVVTLWINRADDALVHLVKRRVVAVGVWDHPAPSVCGVVFGFAGDAEGECAMLGCTVPRRSADARLAAYAEIGSVVFVAADWRDREVATTRTFELPAAVSARLAQAMSRDEVGEAPSGLSPSAEGHVMWRQSVRWYLAPETEPASPYESVEGPFVDEETYRSGIQPGSTSVASEH